MLDSEHYQYNTHKIWLHIITNYIKHNSCRHISAPILGRSHTLALGQIVVGSLPGQMSWQDTSGNIRVSNLLNVKFAQELSQGLITLHFMWKDIRMDCECLRLEKSQKNIYNKSQFYQSLICKYSSPNKKVILNIFGYSYFS